MTHMVYRAREIVAPWHSEDKRQGIGLFPAVDYFKSRGVTIHAVSTGFVPTTRYVAYPVEVMSHVKISGPAELVELLLDTLGEWVIDYDLPAEADKWL